MRFEWDEAKRLANVRKYGLDFVDAPAVFESDIITIEDDRFDYGEVRYSTFGLLNGRVVMVVHTEQEDVIRIISMRKATRNEEINYFTYITH